MRDAMTRETRELEKLWKTDFVDVTVDNKVEASIEDKRALILMEGL